MLLLFIASGKTSTIKGDDSVAEGFIRVPALHEASAGPLHVTIAADCIPTFQHDHRVTSTNDSTSAAGSRHHAPRSPPHA